MREEAIREVMRLVNGDCAAQAVAAATELGVPDALADGPRSAEALAEAVGADADALYRLLRVLSGLGVLEERDGRVFALTERGDLLRAGVPGTLRGMALMMGAPWRRRAYSELAECVRTGHSAFERLYGGYAYYRDDPEAGRVFDEAMADSSTVFMEPLVRGYDFTPFRTIVDVGGGQGRLLAAALAAHPEGRGVLFDLPRVVAGAGEALERAGVAGRCELVGGDFLSAVPDGGDVYLLANILHNWDDEHAARILANCAAAMRPDGRVLLVEGIMPERCDRPVSVTFIDLEMLVMHEGGRQRTAGELDGLLRGAGLRLAGVRPGEPYSLLEATAGRTGR